MADRLQALHKWLQVDLDMATYDLAPASADASFRRYYRLVTDNGSFIVMDAPPEKEDCQPFLDITGRLLACGINVPRVFAQDLGKGFLLLSDLGTQLYLDSLNHENADRLYHDAIGVLFNMQAHASVENLPRCTESLLMREMGLFRDWLLGKHLRKTLHGKPRRQLQELFIFLTESAMAQPQVFVHRDFHSRNLLLHTHNPGVIDYQDAVLGPLSYDLVSLLKDCYIKWPPAKIGQWLRQYHAQLKDVIPVPVSEPEFIRWFDLMGVQRHLKASGIFSRLYHRDGKPGYLRAIPRSLSYIVDLQGVYPELQNLIELLQDVVLPGLARS